MFAAGSVDTVDGMADRTLDERAANILARAVMTFRDRGATDEELVAAGSRGIAEAMAQLAREGDDGTLFELYCTKAVRAAIAEVLAKESPPVLCDGDFVREVSARTKEVSRRLAATRKRYTAEVDRPADELSARALAIFDLYAERSAQIHARLTELLARDETALEISPPDEDGEVAFSVHDFDFPADDAATGWAIILAFDDSDSCAHVELDGWALIQIAWTH